MILSLASNVHSPGRSPMHLVCFCFPSPCKNNTLLCSTCDLPRNCSSKGKPLLDPAIGQRIWLYAFEIMIVPFPFFSEPPYTEKEVNIPKKKEYSDKSQFKGLFFPSKALSSLRPGWFSHNFFCCLSFCLVRAAGEDLLDIPLRVDVCLAQIQEEASGSGIHSLERLTWLSTSPPFADKL